MALHGSSAHAHTRRCLSTGFFDELSACSADNYGQCSQQSVRHSLSFVQRLLSPQHGHRYPATVFIASIRSANSHITRSHPQQRCHGGLAHGGRRESTAVWDFAPCLMLGILSIVLALAVVALAIALIWRERKAAPFRAAATQIDAIVRGGRYSERVNAAPAASTLADSTNRLLEQVAVRDMLIRERERALSGLLGGLQEALAVHRHEIVFANDRFAALVGAANAAELQSRTLADIVHADYQELVADHLRRCLAGEPALERLELEVQPLRQQTARVELSAVRIEYQGGPALLLTLVEMSPRSAVASRSCQVPGLQQRCIPSPQWRPSKFKVTADYNYDGTNLTITIKKKPFYLLPGVIESAIRSYFA